MQVPVEKLVRYVAKMGHSTAWTVVVHDDKRTSDRAQILNIARTASGEKTPKEICEKVAVALTARDDLQESLPIKGNSLLVFAKVAAKLESEKC